MSAATELYMRTMEKVERELGISHRDGVPWWQAPIPSRFHRCSAQTVSLVQGVARCACGGIMYLDDPVWMRRNERRRGR